MSAISHVKSQIAGTRLALGHESFSSVSLDRETYDVTVNRSMDSLLKKLFRTGIVHSDL